MQTTDATYPPNHQSEEPLNGFGQPGPMSVLSEVPSRPTWIGLLGVLSALLLVAAGITLLFGDDTTPTSGATVPVGGPTPELDELVAGATTVKAEASTTTMASTTVAPELTLGSSIDATGHVVVTLAGDHPDPAGAFYNDLLWTASTQVGLTNVPVWSTSNGVDLTFEGDALPDLPPWASGGTTWAPAYLEVGPGDWRIYFAAEDTESRRQCIGAGFGTSPAGPFLPQAEPIVCQIDLGGSIDPTAVTDGDMTYLVWKSDENAIGETSRIWSQPLSSDGLFVEGEPVELLSHSEPWEAPLIENPEMIERADGSWVLTYSANNWFSAEYASGYAICGTPTGPCEKQSIDGPWFGPSVTDGVGVGGGSAVQVGDVTVWLFHGWDESAVGYDNFGERRLHITTIDVNTSGAPLVSTSAP